MLELQTSLYHELLDQPSCDECQGWELCDRPYGLNGDGMGVARATGEDLVVSWPRCPRRWQALRRVGQELLPLSAVMGWAVERGLHQRRRVPAPAARLFRHYLAARELPGALRMARDREQRRLEQAALDAARRGR